MVKAIVVRAGVCHVAVMVNLRDTDMGMDSVKESSKVLIPSPQEERRLLKSKRCSGQPRYYNFRVYFHVSHVMLCGPESLFPIHFHGERDVRNSVDYFSVQTAVK